MIFTETEKLYSPINFYLRDNDMLEHYDGDYWRDDLSHYEARDFLDQIELFLRRDRDTLDKARGMMEYYDSGPVNDKVHSLFPTTEFHGGKLWCVAELTLTEPLTEDEMYELRDWWAGQLSDGWGEGIEQREIKVDRGDLYLKPWTSGDDFEVRTRAELESFLGIKISPGITIEPATPASTAARDELFTQIAKKHCRFETLETRKRDSLDFREVSVWGMRDALEEAFEAGIAHQISRTKGVDRSDAKDAADAESPGFEMLEQQLRDRLADNYTVYKRDMLDLGKEGIFYAAAEILPVQEAYGYFTQEHVFSKSDVEFLLKFENPLEVISDRWSDRMGVTEMVDAIFADQERTLHNGGYTLATDDSATRDGGKGYLFVTADDSDYYMPGVLHVERDDNLFIFPNDECAAKAAEKAGVKLIYGMPDVPDGVYLDTPENRAAIADYFERERLTMPASEELAQKLHERLDANYADYRAGMLRLNSSEVFADAAEIVAVCQSYEFFRDKHTVTVGQAELLLKYADPLDFISDCWIHSPVAEATDIINILTERERTHAGLYERVLTEPAPEPPCGTVGGDEKPSVMDWIRQHAKDARERPTPPKDKSGRNKSEPEL